MQGRESQRPEGSNGVTTEGRGDSDLYAWAYEKVRHGAWERYVRHRPIPRYVSYLEKTQWLSTGELETLQLQSLKDLLSYAKTHVPYYRELFAKIGFDARDVRKREDIAGIPILTKDIIRERYKDFVAPEHEATNVKKSTSGSTGLPLNFEHSLDSNAWREAIKLRGYRWAGYRLGGPTLHYWGQVGKLQGIKGAKIRLDRAFRRDIFIDSMRSDETSMMRSVELLRKTRPTSIVCYTQSCALWARFILDRNLRDWPDIPVICGAEAVLPQDRAVLEKAFGPRVSETYGSREVMLMASECSAHKGMHLTEENLLLEITRDGKPLPAGESGDILVTDLHNYGFPFIRYINGDIAALAEDGPCACGRGLRRLKGVDGRRADTLHDKDGKPIPGLVFHVLFTGTAKDAFAQFQTIQKKDGTVLVKVVRGPAWSDEAVKTMRAKVEDYMRGLPVVIEECADIPPMPNGKRKTIIVEK
jgi:phenylacetate-CoA ligase